MHALFQVLPASCMLRGSRRQLVDAFFLRGCTSSRLSVRRRFALDRRRGSRNLGGGPALRVGGRGRSNTSRLGHTHLGRHSPLGALHRRRRGSAGLLSSLRRRWPVSWLWRYQGRKRLFGDLTCCFNFVVLIIIWFTTEWCSIGW